MKETITVYVTKYVFTTGIQKLEVEYDAEFPTMVACGSGYGRQHYHGDGSQWHRTYESAVKKAKAMQAAKIKSLEKQIAKIKALSFEEA